MQKILLVALLGGLMLGIFLYARRDPGSASAAPGVVSAPPPPAPQAPVAPAPASPPAVADPSDADVCKRLADLCSTSTQRVDAEQCGRDLADARKVSGPASVQRSEQCVAGATTCAAATGCLSGGVGMGALGEYLKGFGAALSR